MIFDGRAFAREIEEHAKEEGAKLPRKPKIVSILVGNDPASELYTRLKQQAAERVGIEYTVMRLKPEEDISVAIERACLETDGVMVQLPIPGKSREETNEILRYLPIEKDVDGLRWEKSGKMPATVRAVLSVLEEIGVDWEKKFVVVGATGSVGKPLVHFLKEKHGVIASEVRSTTEKMRDLIKAGEVVVSCVGKPGLVTGEMVQPDIVAVDVGINQVEGKTVGDMTQDVYNKARVAVPVPGGVGPVTIACLMENAKEIYDSLRRKLPE